MPVIMALFNTMAAFFKDMYDNILIIYAEKGIEPFKKPLLIALPAVLMLYVVFYAPRASKVKVDMDQLEKSQIIAAHYADYNDAKTKLAAYQKRLPLIRDKDEWLNYMMTSTAKAHGISFDSIAAQTESEIGNFLLVSRVVSVTTTYVKFGKWVADIENSPMLLKVTEVSLKKDGSRTGVVRINMKLSSVFPKFGAAGGR
ncbi:MAG: type 4a pilus biogenesis protein PilO [Elusimicrobiota bacterium]